MTTIIKAAGAAEFLALVPHLAGYTPTDSVALVPFHRGRTIGVLRFDLPEADAEIDRIAATMIGMACKLPDADAVAVVVYTDESFAGNADIVHADLVQAIVRRADACGLDVTEALCAAGDGWGSYLDPECPPGGRPLADLAERHPLTGGADVSGDQSTGLDLPAVGPDALGDVARALTGLDRAARALCRADGIPRPHPVEDLDSFGLPVADIDPMALAAVCALDDVPTLFEDCLGWDPGALRPFDAAAMIWCLARPALRDVALTQWAGQLEDGDRALDAQLAWEDGAEYPAELAQHMFGEGPRPDADRLARALALARGVAAVAPVPLRAGPLAAAAWLSWALGRSTAAGWHVERVLEIEPDHGLAGIVGAFVSAGHLPEWAFRRPHRGAPRRTT